MVTGMPKAVLVILVASFMALAGCGGGGGGSNGGGGGPADTRAALLDTISTKFATFNGMNPDQENQEMLAFLRTKPEFVDSGLSDAGGVWGQFADGTTLVIANNVERNPTRAAGLQRSSPIKRSRAGGLPTTANVVIATGFGEFFDTANNAIAEMFSMQPYERAEGGASADALKTMSNVGVLYLTTHGATSPIVRGGPPVYIVWTSTERARDGSTDTKYSADLRDGSMTYFMALTFQGDDPDSFQRRVEVHYGITSKFVEKYWTGAFNKNSIVFMNACSSASDSALNFEIACLNAGASAYLGWTKSVVIRDGVVSAAYLFDRMLGTNEYEDDKEIPPQRPFGYVQVLADMATRKRQYAATMYDASLNPHNNQVAKLQFLTLSSEFGQLAPSIESLTVDEQKDELTVNGTFGDGRGEVFINNNRLTIKTWGANRIVCTIPRSGSNSSGNVVVRAAAPGQISNTVPLTEWSGNVRCTIDGQGTLQTVMNLNVHFRADVHDRRIQPHQTPLRLGSGYLNALDTSGTYECSGVYVSPDGLYSEQWSGAGQIPAFIKPPEGTSPPEVNNVVVQGEFDQDRKWSMAIRAIAIKGNRIRSITKDTQGHVVQDKTEDTDAVWLNVDDLNGHLSILTVGPGYDIPAGSRTLTINSDESMKLEWSAMAAIHAPDATQARSAKIRR